MTSAIRGRDYISRAELARFVVDQFTLFTIVRTTPFRQIASSPGLIISGHGCRPMVECRMEVW